MVSNFCIITSLQKEEKLKTNFWHITIFFFFFLVLFMNFPQNTQMSLVFAIMAWNSIFKLCLKTFYFIGWWWQQPIYNIFVCLLWELYRRFLAKSYLHYQPRDMVNDRGNTRTENLSSVETISVRRQRATESQREEEIFFFLIKMV